ncbi:MAG: hypothetical protein ACTHJH_00120 [Marmoricola sp.]
MSTGTLTRAAAPVVVLDHDERCGCGQELDCCAGEHCPRCGHERTRR